MMNIMVHTESTYFNRVFQSRWAMAQWLGAIMRSDADGEITRIECRNSDGSVETLYTRSK